MLCKFCNTDARKNGRTGNGSQRFKCGKCKRTWIDNRKGNNFLDAESQALIRSLRSRGFSTRQIVAITGFAKYTVGKYGKGVEPQQCQCGKKFGHRGWCWFRYAQSTRRQIALHGKAVNPDEPQSIYVPGFCDDCKKPLKWGGQRCRDCYIANAERKREVHLKDEPQRQQRKQELLERRNIKLWKTLTRKLQMALRQPNLQAIKSLQREYEQARISLT